VADEFFPLEQFEHRPIGVGQGLGVPDHDLHQGIVVELGGGDGVLRRDQRLSTGRIGV